MKKQLAEMLADCLDWIEREGRTASQAADRFPAHREELLVLLGTIHQVAENSNALPSAEFERAAAVRMENLLQARQKAAAVEQSVTFSKPTRLKHRNAHQTGLRRFSMSWIIVIFTAASLLLGGGGVAYASTDALPGDGLYSVKTIVQEARLAFSDDQGDVELLAGFLTQNIEEMNQLAAQGRWDDLDIGLDEYQENLDALLKTRSRLSYLDAPNAEALNSRIQTELQTHSDELVQLQTKLQDRERLQEKVQEPTEDPIQDQTQDQIHDNIHDQLQDAIQQTDQGKIYGPADGGPSEEPGSPNGAGPGEPHSGDGGGTNSGQGGKP